MYHASNMNDKSRILCYLKIWLNKDSKKVNIVSLFREYESVYFQKKGLKIKVYSVNLIILSMQNFFYSIMLK